MKNNDDNTPRHPVFDLLAKYRAIFQAAWLARGELAGPQRLADEAAFLPAALSLQSTPVHPAPRRLAWVLMALFVLALLWACLGQIDIVAVAPGRVVVSERTNVIQPLERSVVQRIVVKDGDRVTAAQSLVELDAIAANADKASVQEQLRVATIDTRRARQVQAMLLNSKQGRQSSRGSDDDSADPRLQTQVNPQLQTEWADISARLAKLNAESARRQAEIATAQAVVSKLEATVPMAQSREVDFKRLVDQGYMSSHATQDKTRERVELERDLTTQRARLREAQAALSESANNKSAYLAELMHSLQDRQTQADLKRSQAIQELAKATQREKLTTLTAPVDGVVQQLAIFTAGGVVTEAQALMVIVPEAAQVTAEVTLDNKDIGFVNAGQAVTIKLETYPYIRYGTLPAVVTRVTSDAVNDEKRGAIFPATLALGKTNINIDGKVIKLSPGMNVTAEIKTGQRRVIEYLLSPIQRAGGESLRER